MTELASHQVVAGVNLLIQSPRCEDLVQEMRGILANWDMYPSRYSADLAPLNALLDVGVQKLYIV